MNEEVRRLPLWKNCLDEMRRQGLEYGKSWPVSFFVKELSVQHNTVQFNFSIHAIRLELEKEGFYLSAEGQHGHGFYLVQAAANERVIRQGSRRIKRKLKRLVVLGRTTKRNQLTEAQQRTLQAATDSANMKLLFLSRERKIAAFLEKSNAKLLLD